MEENKDIIQEISIDNDLNNVDNNITEQTIEITEEVKPKKTKKKTKKEIEYITEKCKIIQSYKNTIVINFHDKCISFNIENNTYKKDGFIEVEYTGEISKKNFKIKLK